MAFRTATAVAFAGSKCPALLTIVPADGLVPYDEIAGFDLEKFKRSHQVKLSRYLPRDVLLVGAIDVALNATDNVIQGWSLHSHDILSRPLTKSEKNQLKRAYPANKEVGIHRPVKVEPIKDGELRQTAAYVYKSYFTKRSSYIAKPKSDRLPYWNSDPQSFSPAEGAALQTYLERYKVADPIMLIGLKRVRTKHISDLRFMRTSK